MPPDALPHGSVVTSPNPREDSEMPADSQPDHSPSDDKSPGSTSKDKKPNPKDPSRPRRKKARRACFACQRAHLTCGDERPCLRCIKRGLKDHCHDGVRKKAKYLHDAPNEALVPSTFPQPTPRSTSQLPQSSQADVSSMGHPPSYYPTPVAPAGFAPFGQTPSSGPVNSPSTQDSPLLNPYVSQQNIINQAYSSASNHQMNAPQESVNHTSPDGPKTNQPYNAPFFDPADPSLFNFDISSLNFGNHYGALEFGMLGHMSSGAVGTPDADNSNLMNSISQGGNIAFDPSSSNSYPGAFPYSSTFGDWQPTADNGARQGSNGQMFGPHMPGDGSNNNFEGQMNFPTAFAIGENGSISSASPSGNLMDFGAGYNSSPVSSANHLFHNQNQSHPHEFGRLQHRPPIRSSFSANDIHQRSTFSKRRRDTSDVYKSVTAPYSYTTGFHALTACVQKRYSPQKTVRLAKALAAIRPSLISCTRQLNEDDLVFMEKCFQRTLFEYDEFVTAYGTPALICRRTGEVAGVSKEFSLLTGWQRDVLLGKTVNLNVNLGNASGSQTGTSTRGTATPRALNSGESPGRQQSVLLPELMEEDDVIGFYEDFAQIAFGDSRGYCIKPCKLLKYKTKDDPGWGPGSAAERGTSRGGDSKPIGPLISGESGMNSLGDQDGKVSCMYCWSVKRDVFDIPMMIVMNFLPII